MMKPPATGAFTTQDMGGPQTGASDADFAAQLQALGINPGRLGAQPAPVRPKASPADPLAQMAQIAQAPTQPVRPRKAKFVPGKPGRPVSGQTAHQMLQDPAVLDTLMAALQAWDAENPGKKPKGRDIHAMLPGVSYPQALTIKRKLDKALGRAMTAGDYNQRGAAAALKG